MDLTSKRITREILKGYKIRPLKKWGQNFLVSRTALKRIVNGAGLKKTDTVLEIGPGIGTLTGELARRAKKVIAIEKDRRMIEILKDLLKDYSNVEIVEGDVLKLPTTNYQLPTDYKVVANLPYYIVSPVIRKLLESQNPPKELILMIQKEVAQRICAHPPRMGLLSVSVQFYSRSEIICYISKNSFWPPPKVDGAIIRISPISTNILPANVNLFFEIVRAGFSHPRKTLANNLSFGLKLNKEQTKVWLLDNKISPNQRAQSLKVEDWKNLTATFSNILSYQNNDQENKPR